MQATKNFSNSIYLLLTIFCLLIFPHYTQEFGFKFDGDDDSGEHGKQLTKHRALEKKFKFRKIERVFVDTENYGDDDDIDVDKSIKKDLSDENDVPFERVRNAQKDDRAPKKQSREKRVKTSTSDERDSSEIDFDQSQSFLSRIFGGFFGSDKEEKQDTQKKNEKKQKHSKSVEEKSNSIIDWLKWLGVKLGKLNAAEEKEKIKATGDSWWMYLDRWPINSFFPIGKQPKPVSMPRQKNSIKQNGDDSSAEVLPMSQEHFESLLHTLPGFVVNASHVSNTECRQHMQIFHRQLRGNKLWTLQMLDATGKISSGILRGNINQFGDFDLCTQIRTVVKVTSDIPMRIRGKYCLAHIETQTDVSELKLPVYLAHARELWNSHLGNPGHFVPRYAVANWGVCIPHSCPAEVVQEMIETNLRPYNTTGIEFHVEVNDNDCYIRQSRKWTKLMEKDKKFAMTVVCISSLALLVFISLLYEQRSIFNKILEALKNLRGPNENIKTENNEVDDEVDSNNIRPEGTNSNENNTDEVVNATAAPSSDTTYEHSASFKQFLQEIIKSFSPRRTLTVLLSEENTDFPILHVLKLGATFMLYVCLKYLMIGHLPITNRDQLVRAVDHPFSIMFRAPLLYADILLLIGGFFSAYQLSSEMEQKSYIQLLKCLVSKICRYLPTLFVVILFQTWILPHLNSGPLWTNLIGQNSRLCEQQMWRNVFSVQNAIDFEETCSPMTISFALEVQLFLLGPLIVWLYYTNSDAAFYTYGAIHAMSVAARFSRTNREHLSVTLFHGINVSKFYRTANILFSSPISRATPYLLGIGAGLLHRSEYGSLQCATNLIPFGWILAILGIVWCFWAPSTGMTGSYIYTPNNAASYAAWSPLILGLAICWLIFMFPKMEKSVLGFLTNSRPIIFLSRITFPIQLVMYVVVLYNTASVKEAQKFHMLELININEIGFILFYAIMLAFIVDIPTNQIRRLLVNRLFRERIQTEQEPTSQSEASEEPSEQIVSDTPEPSETIWASDPEEEELKYLTRRRSSTINSESIVTKANTTDQIDEIETKEEVAEEEQEEEEEEEEEVEVDITEAEEVKKSPIISTKKPVIEETKPTYTRRRRPISDD
ncbi:uncharacterized protein LOC119669846 [Teleopsis dalmanni]|uniref:uncharacterized protein LOC119669846 n=1 Tax=Teleopsis dalmanni TaxID=139649 RepID=UPI0018CCF0C3|nr:uncharacterized protein LOC119669846 [Teleopsis dalmanni]